MNPKKLSFLQFSSPCFFNPGIVRLLSPPEGLSEEEIVQRLVDGELTQPYILETRSERRPHFAHDSVQSVMQARLALEFPRYLRRTCQGNVLA